MNYPTYHTRQVTDKFEEHAKSIGLSISGWHEGEPSTGRWVTAGPHLNRTTYLRAQVIEVVEGREQIVVEWSIHSQTKLLSVQWFTVNQSSNTTTTIDRFFQLTKNDVDDIVAKIQSGREALHAAKLAVKQIPADLKKDISATYLK